MISSMVCAVVYISAHSVRATYINLEPVCTAVEVGCSSSGVGNVASLLSNQDTRRKCRNVLISEVARVVYTWSGKSCLERCPQFRRVLLMDSAV